MSDSIEAAKAAVARKCGNCTWWVARDARDDLGQCRADKPKAGENNRAAWPLTAPDEWCQFFAQNYRHIPRPDVIRDFLANAEARAQKEEKERAARRIR